MKKIQHVTNFKLPVEPRVPTRNILGETEQVLPFVPGGVISGLVFDEFSRLGLLFEATFFAQPGKRDVEADGLGGDWKSRVMNKMCGETDSGTKVWPVGILQYFIYSTNTFCSDLNFPMIMRVSWL
jgi:hypothetical protein